MKSILIACLYLSSFFLLQAAHHNHEMSNLPVSPDEQKKLTPEAVLADLKAGNERYLKGAHSDPNAAARIKAATKGQYPKAYVLSCVDSRVPVELVFDQGIGDIFVGRVAGNVENVDQLGSMEYAAAVGGVKLIVVMGHESCGAVKSACDHVRLGNATLLLEKIAPAVNNVDGFEDEDRTSKNTEFVKQVVKTNVERTVADIRDRSPLLNRMEEQGKLMIVGAYYSLHDGNVSFME